MHIYLVLVTKHVIDQMHVHYILQQ